MSTPPKATPTTPQWAIEAASEVAYRINPAHRRFGEKPDIAGIIAKHAPPPAAPVAATPTPRTDAVVEFDDFTNNGEPIGVVPVNFARQLEIELAEARAERDAARARFNELIELAYVPTPHGPNYRWWAKTYKELHEAAEKSAEFWRREYEGLPSDQLISIAIMRSVCRECDFRTLEEYEADLTRLRAVADELAGALEIAKMTVECASLDKDRTELPWYRACKKALARYHAATNPAAAIKPDIHRKE